jgi:hypothetical protein
MTTFRLTYAVPLNLAVTVEADNEDDAQEIAWDEAQEYLQTVYGNGLHVTADGDLDGIGADEVNEVPS